MRVCTVRSSAVSMRPASLRCSECAVTWIGEAKTLTALMFEVNQVRVPSVSSTYGTSSMILPWP